VPSPGWPAALVCGDVGLRPFRLRDAQAWSESRIRNEDWLAPWEGRQPSLPASTWQERHSPSAFAGMLRTMRRESRAGRSLPFAVMLSGSLVGQVTVSNVVRGAFQSASVGYWVDRSAAGRGVIPTALALVVDHCFTEVSLHRIEANIRPENAPSLRVMRKLGFREEGLHPRFLFIDGDWRDHLSFALTTEDVPDGLLSQLRHTG
jgi:ribosomal-protein-alanine N-acetyltransferase